MPQEGPVPAKSFYGAVDPTTSLKLLKGVPPLKAAFASRHSSETSQEVSKQSSTKKQRGKNCTGHFGCNNLAVFIETSGTLYCREYRPHQVPTAIGVEKKPNKNSSKRK